MDIPVWHDDQLGTASIILAPAFFASPGHISGSGLASANITGSLFMDLENVSGINQYNLYQDF